MKIFDKFKQKEAEVTVRELLGNDTVKKVVEDFIRDHLPTAEGIIIIWNSKAECLMDGDGMSEVEMIGSLHQWGHRIEHEGRPR